MTVVGSINQLGIFSNQCNYNVNLGIVLRWVDTNNWYKACSDGQHLAIFGDVNGQPWMIQQVSVSIGAGVSQTLHFRSRGTTLSVNVWPTDTAEPQGWMINANDSTFATGQVGIRVFEQPTTVITIKSFKAVKI